MKKLLAIILTLCFVLSLAACGSDSDTASTTQPESSSNESSSKPKPLGSAIETSSEANSDEDTNNAGGTVIEYTSVAEGYIDHPTIWRANIVKFNGFECMDQEYLFIPKGATIMSDSICAIFCYKVEDNAMVLEPNKSKAMGCTLNPSGYSVQHKSGTFQTVEDVLVRISVKGKLSDVNIFFPKEMEGGAELYSLDEALVAFAEK